MKLLSETQFDIQKFYGNMVILYPEGRSDLVEKLKEQLDISGYVYHCRAVGPSLLMKGDSFDELVALFDRCVCLVPVINQELFEESNIVTLSMYWYFIGYMRSKFPEAIVPFSPSDKTDLKSTPLQGIDIMYDLEAFMQKIPTKFSSKLLRYNYYENRMTNYYASRRINFRCLRLSFQIYEKSFQNARKYYNDAIEFDRTDEEFDAYLEKNLICGSRVVSFGTETKLEPQMMVYRDEVHPYVADYPKSLAGKRTYRRMTEKERQVTGIRAEFTVDVLVPVHKLLGVYLKCYLTCPDPDCPVNMLLALMEADFTNGSTSEFDFDDFDMLSFWKDVYPRSAYVDEASSRLYFSLNFKTSEPPLKADPSLNIGETLDYIFPQ